MANPQQQEMLRRLQQLQDRMLEEQKALATETVEASVGGGAVKVIMNGHQKLQAIAIEPRLLDPAEAEMLTDLLIAAVNEAVDASQGLASQRMGAITGGLGLPGGPVGG